MSKKLMTGLLMIAMMILLSGCKGNADDIKVAFVTDVADETNAATITTSITVTEAVKEEASTSPKYTTVTEGFDWGPAITKVILDTGVTLDSTTLSSDSFTATSVKEFTTSGSVEPTVLTGEREVTAVYVSDKMGNKSTEGAYLTIEMKVEPNLAASSPFYNEAATGLSKYADTSYIIKLTEGSLLITTAGKSYNMKATDKSGYQGNRSLIAEDFDTTGSYTKGDITLHYASFTPKTAATEEGSNPLIIWLHGAGEGGTDPTIVLLGNKVVNLATEEIQSFFDDTGAYILVPQAPTMWMDGGDGTYTSDGTSCYTESLMGLIEEYVSKHPEIDKNRLYLGGCSNGGYMTINMIIHYPDYFAAAYPVCEAYSNSWLSKEQVKSIVNMPIWLTQAKSDPVVKVYSGGTRLKDYSNAVYDRLTSAGATNIHYSLFDTVVDLSGTYFKEGTKEPYEYIGHFSWIYTLNNQCKEEMYGMDITLFEWLSRQSK